MEQGIEVSNNFQFPMINFQFKLTWLPKKTFEILAIIPWPEIKSKETKAVAEAGETMEIKGFRKGKAPTVRVAAALGQNKILKLTLEKIIPEAYQKALSQFGLQPVLSPKIELMSSKEKEDWQIKFTSCETPEVKLGNYRQQLKGLKSADSIWTPDKGNQPPNSTNSKQPENKDRKMDKILQWLLDNIKVEISDLLVETEINRKLSALLEQTQKLGITVEQYLLSTGKTAESLRGEYKSQVVKSLSLQFILEAIAEEEKIAVNPQDIEKIISEAKNEEERKVMERQKYLLASLLRQQKTLDFLANL